MLPTHLSSGCLPHVITSTCCSQTLAADGVLKAEPPVTDETSRRRRRERGGSLKFDGCSSERGRDKTCSQGTSVTWGRRVINEQTSTASWQSPATDRTTETKIYKRRRRSFIQKSSISLLNVSFPDSSSTFEKQKFLIFIVGSFHDWWKRTLLLSNMFLIRTRVTFSSIIFIIYHLWETTQTDADHREIRLTCLRWTDTKIAPNV